ncbi:MAG: signal peptidase I [Acidobacteriota bacterium]|nr:signal peptidase I [Acidobacteriota bacterium]
MDEPNHNETEIPLTIQEAHVPVEASQQQRPHESNRGAVSLFMRDLLFSAVFVMVFMSLYQPVVVEGTSMLPRLENDDRLFINKFIYRFEDIHRGDVVVFRYPPDPSKSYIKRVIALPGDKLWIDQGQVFVNGKPIRESYVPPQYRDFKSYPEITLPAHEYFVLGDHRNIASDSRDFGPVGRSFIYGKAVLIYWPARDAGVVH